MIGRSKADHFDSLIGRGTVSEGDIVFAGVLRIDGDLKGNVSCSGNEGGTLVVSESGKVEGKIDVPRVVIHGSGAGPVRASEHVELLPGARVTGDVSYKSIVIHAGAIVTGGRVHGDAEESESTVALKVASA